ncbi:hypothetical protein PPGU19_038630 [Paraburkholderia sp. PGU19]|uniref:hypothetical protein n=1 Tax=Paraburkholderia sp. PGU19 TaxID=2735434 RepID=UPI0015DCDE3D|nr:hypothetical protein [Paraburkholderia sp. PGU19]BCF99294.1 hypothetical protein PPGU19_038630 [Paraburkholderia sp. PGU19]
MFDYHLHLLIRDHKRGHNLRGLWSVVKFLHDCIRAHAPVHFIVPLRDRYVGPALSLELETSVGAHSRDEIDAGRRAA